MRIPIVSRSVLSLFPSLSALSFPFNAVALILASCSVFRKAEGDIIDESRKLGKNLNTSSYSETYDLVLY